ncbi:MAG TPA: RidA family protein [Steroidobacteraceae bacterium]|nr:RidA family protein [Steroidobacteraceae bacterium]
MQKKSAALAALSLLSASLALAGDITRYALPGGSKFPIARAVAVPAGYELIFHSGFTADPADPKAQQGSAAYWGNTKTQTLSVLHKIQDSLKGTGATLAEVVKMNVFLVADPSTGRMDFSGFMAGYTQFFGTPAQPNLPARTAVQVAGLAAPGALVEIEVVLAHKSAP